MNRAQLEQIIAEEIESILTELSEIEEIAVKKRKPQAGAGKRFTSKADPVGPNKKTGTEFRSAGTVPNIKNRKIGPKGSTGYNDRKIVGQKILNAIRRGGPAGRRLEALLKNAMNKKGNPVAGSRGLLKRKWTQRDLLYSYVWALASDYIAKGGTASKFKISNIKPKQEKGGTASNSGTSED